MADFIVGSPVRDEDFWFRDGFIEDLWEALEKHNVLLLAPRRIGKTSVMYRMLDYPKDSWLVIHLNVEELKTPDEFFITLVDAINEHQPDYLRETLAATWGFLKGILSNIETIEAFELKLALRKSEDLKENWQVRATQLMDRILKSNQKVLFIIDELPDMLNGILSYSAEEYETFLHWFRKLRDKSLSTDIRWLLGGSVNLIASLDQQGKVKLINDLKVEPLSSFNEKEVTEFVTNMFETREVRFDDSAAVYPEGERDVTCYLLNKLSLDDKGISKNTLFNLYRQAEEQKTNKRTGTALSQAFQRLLLHLQSDFYIEETDSGRYDFSSRLLKTWWRKYYGYENEES